MLVDQSLAIIHTIMSALHENAIWSGKQDWLGCRSKHDV
jgi:hypothetical protein